VLDGAGLDGEYWYRNLRDAVRFDAASTALLGDGYGVFIESSPHPVLTVGVQETVEEARGEGSVGTTGVAGVRILGSLRRGDGGPERFACSLSEAWSCGVQVDWSKVYDGTGAKRITLPTYPFQRKRYWPEGAGGGIGDLAAAGLDTAEHPLLGAALAAAGDSGRVLFSARLSTVTHAWLSDHTTRGVVLVPGSLFVELALHAGSRVGCTLLEELILRAPLLLDERGAVQVQLSVGAPDETGRDLTIHSRPMGGSEREIGFDEGWVCNATGRLGPEGAVEQEWLRPQLAVLSASEWPPSGVVRVDVEEIYDRLAALGLEYGPAFRGLRAAWQGQDGLFAEVRLSDGQARADLFGFHPALLDGAVQLAALAPGWGDALTEEEEDATEVRIVGSWRRVALHARGASAVRVSISQPDGLDTGDGLSLVATDERGALVASVQGLSASEIAVARRDGVTARVGDSLFGLDWVKVLLARGTTSARGWIVMTDGESSLAKACVRGHLSSGGSRVEVFEDWAALQEGLVARSTAFRAVLVDVASLPGTQGSATVAVASLPETQGSATVAVADSESLRTASCDLPVQVRSALDGVLELLRWWLANEEMVDTKLVLLTHGAIAVLPGEDVPNLPAAAVGGLVRSAQMESPNQIVLIDLDDDDASWGALAGALTLDEPQLAVREGIVYAPRLSRAGSRSRSGARQKSRPDARGKTVSPPDPDGTALITGGTGGIGALLARHLVVKHGISNLLLASRRGPQAQGAAELETELTSLGANVSIVACDVSDRAELERLLAGIPADRPLRRVVHAAGVLDDATIGSLTAEQLDRVLAPKVQAAHHLHELTRGLELSDFVLFSSLAGTLGGAGQGSYAAGNAFLDGLAAHRRALGLPGMSLAWGLWAAGSGMTGHLSETDLTRIRRAGAGALSTEEGLELFDVAHTAEEALLVPMRLNTPALRTQAAAGVLPALLRGLVPMPPGKILQAGEDSLARRLARATGEERERLMLETVRSEVAIVLGHDSPEGIAVERKFLEIGFDSLAAVELRNRLKTLTGLGLADTVVFDHPTTLELARHLSAELDISARDADGQPVEQESRKVRSGGPPGDTLSSLLRGAQELGAAGEFMTMVASASRFRPSFDGPLDADQTPEWVELSQGEKSPALICIPSILATAGPHQYARFAKSFCGSREISVLALPGFVDGELLPASRDVAIETEAEIIRRRTDGAPFALLGHSTGGMVAHELAVQLEGVGAPPAAVVLVDTYSHLTMLEMAPDVLVAMIERDGSYVSISDVRLTAMGAYSRLFADWSPSEIAAPTLLVRASEPIPGASADGEWRSSWSLAHVAVDVRGNHFSMLEEHVEGTAHAVQEWLSANFDDK
jgi:thioesterase domain-containing protein/NAD(P)-dependent dehydrogenase (short-subunit alcohol dehydrogenase family)